MAVVREGESRMSKVIEMEQSEDGTVEMKKEEEAEPGFTIQ